MDRFTLRISHDLASRFDALAATLGGRSRLLRRLMEEAVQEAQPLATLSPQPIKSSKLYLRLCASDSALLEAEADRIGLSRTQWTTALIRRRLRGQPQLTPPQAIELIGMRRELHRIGVNVNQIARALNTAVLEGSVLDLEIAQVAAFASEIRGHLGALDDAMAGNRAYWTGKP